MEKVKFHLACNYFIKGFIREIQRQYITLPESNILTTRTIFLCFLQHPRSKIGGSQRLALFSYNHTEKAGSAGTFKHIIFRLNQIRYDLAQFMMYKSVISSVLRYISTMSISNLYLRYSFLSSSISASTRK